MFRVGHGFDIHKLVLGRNLILGGVHIPYEYGLLGHSDADVLIHAVIDALIGALALGDIGKFFPDTQAEYKNANSRVLLREIVSIIKLEGNYKLSNLDATLIIEEPKLREYIDEMRQNLAKDLMVDIDQISIKAKTNEGVDSIGRGEAVAAHVVVLLIK
jgi:2-C-methyl-D-erythritol 2,4-cyclodiphosphate synthase